MVRLSLCWGVFLLSLWFNSWGNWTTVWFAVILVRLIMAQRLRDNRDAVVLATLQMTALWMLLLIPQWSAMSCWILAAFPPIQGWSKRGENLPVDLLDAAGLGVWGYSALTLAHPAAALLWLGWCFSGTKWALARCAAFLMFGSAWYWADSDWGVWLFVVAGCGWLACESRRDILQHLIDRFAVTALSVLPASLWRGGDVVVLDGLWFLITEPWKRLATLLAGSRNR